MMAENNKLTFASNLGQKNTIKTTKKPGGKHNSNKKQPVDQASWVWEKKKGNNNQPWLQEKNKHKPGKSQCNATQAEGVSESLF